MSKLKKQFILSDIDGTLSDHAQRKKLLPDYDKYYEKMGEDKPIEWVRTLLKNLPDNVEVYLITGRQEKFRMKTEDWLFKYGLLNRINGMYMRPNSSLMKNSELKVMQIETILRKEKIEPKDIIFVLEDNPSSKKMIEKTYRIPVILLEGWHDDMDAN